MATYLLCSYITHLLVPNYISSYFFATVYSRAYLVWLCEGARRSAHYHLHTQETTVILAGRGTASCLSEPQPLPLRKGEQYIGFFLLPVSLTRQKQSA